jgi:hypothetical protein
MKPTKKSAENPTNDLESGKLQKSVFARPAKCTNVRTIFFQCVKKNAIVQINLFRHDVSLKVKDLFRIAIVTR